MTIFETETMAELCIKQGLYADGVDIYRRLVTHAPDEVTRARHRRRLAELEGQLGPSLPPPRPPEDAPPPALDVRRENDALVLGWNLPEGTRAPAIQLLLLRRTAGGIETEARTLRLDGPRGRTTLTVGGLHSVRAAAGRLDGERFIPLVRWT